MRCLELLSPLIHGEEGWVSIVPHCSALQPSLTTLCHKTFENNLSEDKISRFLKYTPLVKDLSHEQRGLYPFNGAEEPEFDSSLSDEVFFHLLSIKIPPSHDGLIFPNVVTLGWHTDRSQGISQVLFFRSPRITDYNFSFPFQPKYIPSIRRTISSIRTSTPLQGLWFRFLEKDEFGEVRDEALTDLAQSWAQSQQDLTRMELSGFVLRDPLRIVEGHYRLDTLRLGTIIYQTIGGITDVFKTIASGSPNLTDLELSFRQSEVCVNNYLDSSPSPFSFSILHPLLQLVRLNSLSIKCDHTLPLDAAHIKTIGETWPKMGMLTLCPTPSRSLRSGTPFSSLATVAAYFPRGLVWFGHYFVLDDTKLPHPSHTFTYLSRLDVGTTQLAQRRSSEVVRFLCRLCPYRFWLAWDGANGSHSTWKKTKKQLDTHYPPRGRDDWF